MSLTREAKHGYVATCSDGNHSTGARILCWDRDHRNGGAPIVALVNIGFGEAIYSFHLDGRCPHDSGVILRDAPAPKASGVDWIVRWRSEDGLRRHAALHYTKEAVSAHARFLISKGRSHVSVIEAPWTDGMGLEAESSDE